MAQMPEDAAGREVLADAAGRTGGVAGLAVEGDPGLGLEAGAGQPIRVEQLFGHGGTVTDPT
jgi:hypothetical protein